MAALLSLLINKHGQKKRDCHPYKCRAYPSDLKNVKKQKRQKWERTKLQPSQETFKLLFTVAVKPSGDISAEPAEGQKIETCCKTGWGTCDPRAKCGPREHLIWPASEFSLPKLGYNIASKRSSMISRYG